MGGRTGGKRRFPYCYFPCTRTTYPHLPTTMERGMEISLVSKGPPKPPVRRVLEAHAEGIELGDKARSSERDTHRSDACRCERSFGFGRRGMGSSWPSRASSWRSPNIVANFYQRPIAKVNHAYSPQIDKSTRLMVQTNTALQKLLPARKIPLRLASL